MKDCCVGRDQINYIDAVVDYLVLLFCAYKFTEATVAANFMYPVHEHSGAASNCCLLLCLAH